MSLKVYSYQYKEGLKYPIFDDHRDHHPDDQRGNHQDPVLFVEAEKGLKYKGHDQNTDNHNNLGSFNAQGKIKQAQYPATRVKLRKKRGEPKAVDQAKKDSDDIKKPQFFGPFFFPGGKKVEQCRNQDGDRDEEFDNVAGHVHNIKMGQ